MDFNERLEFCRKAARNESTEHYPILSNFWTGIVLDSGVPLQDALYDWDRMYKIMCEFHERYKFDFYMDFSTRNQFGLLDSLGGNPYTVDYDKQQINVKDFSMMDPEDYDLLINGNLAEFMWTVVTRKKSREADAPDIKERIEKFFDEYAKLQDYIARITSQMKDAYQVPSCYWGADNAPAENLFDGFRGIKGFSMDLRRIPDKLRAGMDSLYNQINIPTWDYYFSEYAPDNDYAVFDIMESFLAHSVLSEQQFGELFWSYIEPYLMKCAESGKLVLCFVESSMLRFADYFERIPNGTLCILSEQDDPFELHRRLPNVSIAGGMDTQMLRHGTVQGNIDYTKRVIDELGDGGLIFTQNKMVAFKDDYARENLLAVMDYIRSI